MQPRINTDLYFYISVFSVTSVANTNYYTIELTKNKSGQEKKKKQIIAQNA